MSQRQPFYQNWKQLNIFKKLKKRVDALIDSPNEFSSKAIELEAKIIDEQIDLKLSSTPADVLKKYHTGARIQPVSNYSIKELRRMDINRLASIKGIGPKSAYSIKESAEIYARELGQSEKLRLSYDNHNQNDTKLVGCLYNYDKSSKIAEDAKFIKSSYLKDDDSTIEFAKIAAHPILWIFSRKKDKATESISKIRELLESPLVTEVEALEEKRSAVLKTEHNEYWKAFKSDPARFYSLLEECESKNSKRGKRPEDTSYLDVFDSELLEEIKHVELQTSGLLCILRPYQTFGVKYILYQKNVLLGDEMGLGKTIEAIATIVSLRNSGETHFAVVCPASVLINWQREISKHSDLKSYILHGKEFENNNRMWINKGGVAIINYESTSKFACDRLISLTVVDEAHYIKNYRADRTVNTIKILNISKRRLFMSGTPLENNIKEMVSLINMLQPNIVAKILSLPQPIEKEAFKHIVSPVYFRRTRDAVWREMPDLQIVEDVIELSDTERQLYIGLVQQRNMAAFAKMRQYSFILSDSKDSSKLQRIKEICEEAFENNRKVIIFSSYLHTIKKIKDFLGKTVYGPITGSISPQTRQEIIDDFSEHDGGAALLSQIIAGGTGLNIQKASVIIICEPQYKPSIENQAIARAYRIGQTSNVTVYRLLGEKTIDESILQVLKEKQALFDAYADKSEIGEQSITLSESEIANYVFENSKIS